MRRLKRSVAGFTLVETLAAFAIFVVTAGMIFSAITAALRNASRVSFEQKAVRHARSHLAMFGVSALIVPGISRGRTDDGLLWEQTVQPVPAALGSTNMAQPIGYWLTLKVSPVSSLNVSQQMLEIRSFEIR